MRWGRRFSQGVLEGGGLIGLVGLSSELCSCSWYLSAIRTVHVHALIAQG